LFLPVTPGRKNDPAELTLGKKTPKTKKPIFSGTALPLFNGSRFLFIEKFAAEAL
jgi:hypothetical protein